jgi:hypothetical protein
VSAVDTLVTIATGLNASPEDLRAAALRMRHGAVRVGELLDDVREVCPMA